MTINTGAQQWAQMRDGVKKRTNRIFAGCIFLITGLFSLQAHAIWQQANIQGADMVTSIAVDPNSLSTAYAGGYSSFSQQNPVAGLYRTIDNGLSWSQITVQNMQLSMITHIAVLPQAAFGGATTLIVVGHGSLATGYSTYRVSITGTTGFASATANVVSFPNSKRITPSAITVSKNGYVYLSGRNEDIIGEYLVMRLEGQSGTVWTSVANAEYNDLEVVESAFATSNPMIVGKSPGTLSNNFYLQSPGIYYATDSLTSTVAFQQAGGQTPTVTTPDGSSFLSPTASKGINPGRYFFSFVGTTAVDSRSGFYSCDTNVSTMSCVRQSANMYAGLTSNSSGVLYGIFYSYNGGPAQLEYSTNCGASWLPTTETQPPSTGFVKELVVNGSTIYALGNDNRLRYSTVTTPATTVQCTGSTPIGGGGGVVGTNPIDVQLLPVTYTPLTSVQPGGALTATVNLFNAGTQIINANTVQVSIQLLGATLANPSFPPTGCTLSGQTALNCTVSNQITSGGQSPITLNLTAATAGTARVTATATLSGDANPNNNTSNSTGVTIGTGVGVGNGTNVAPTASPVTFTVDLRQASYSGSIFVSDQNQDQVSINVTNQGSYGALTFLTTTASSGQSVSFTYTPDKSRITSAITRDTAQVTVTDGKGGSTLVYLSFNFTNNNVGTSSPSSGGAVHPFGILVAMLFMAWMRRRAVV